MDRVTDEWLREADQRAQELASKKHPADFLSRRWVTALRLAFAQAVAREFLNLSEQELAGMLRYRKLHLDMKDFYTASQYDRGIDALQRLIADTRARFGLED